MKRNAVALILHPYKNVLVGKEELKSGLNRFADTVISIGKQYPAIHISIILPGYMLECIDPLKLLELRALHKNGALEWLLSGYTEPFLSFSPAWLSRENIACGVATFAELTGCKPTGFSLPFSNWEPSLIDTFRSCGLQYGVLGNSLLPADMRRLCGYWTTEHGGSSFFIFPSNSLHYFTAPADIAGWLKNIFMADPRSSMHNQSITLSYLVPLIHDPAIDPYSWLVNAIASMNEQLSQHQMVTCQEIMGYAPPLGLQYLPPSLVFDRGEAETVPYFQNYLHTFDQVGIIERRLMELCETIAADHESRMLESVKKDLFAVQDINHYLPKKNGGFRSMADRLFCYQKLIAVDQTLHAKEKIESGLVKIVDFLKTGAKSIVMNNKELKLYIDHKNGGHIFELDYMPKRLNLCAGYNPNRFALPGICEPDVSCTAFIDRLLLPATTAAEYMGRQFVDSGDFVSGPFDYKVKKTASSTRVVLNRRGTIIQNDKTCPLTIEKVFGLEKKGQALSFSYQLTNNSLMRYDFRMAIELTLSLPGAARGAAHLFVKKEPLVLDTTPVVLSSITEWEIEDTVSGVRIVFFNQKPIDLWCFTTSHNLQEPCEYQGTTFVLSSTVALGENSVWGHMGRITCTPLAGKEMVQDAI